MKNKLKSTTFKVLFTKGTAEIFGLPLLKKFVVEASDDLTTDLWFSNGHGLEVDIDMVSCQQHVILRCEDGSYEDAVLEAIPFPEGCLSLCVMGDSDTVPMQRSDIVELQFPDEFSDVDVDATLQDLVGGI
jgi:hypothetical protein